MIPAIWMGVKWMSLGLLLLSHPFYVSITQINYNVRLQRLEIAVKVFTDDLALALQPENPDILLLGGTAESPLADSLIDRYLQQHLQIRVNGEAASLHYLSKEADPEVVWCYVEARDIPFPQQVYVKNTLLLAQFETQLNIVHVHTGETEKSLLLNRSQQEGVLDFR